MSAPSLVDRLPHDHDARIARVLLSLDGLSVGDAFGQRFFYPPSVESLIAERAIPAPPWPYTDDTEMALGIAEVLQRRGRIDPDALAGVFARRYARRPTRGYGGTAHSVLQAIGAGVDWEQASAAAFGGMGSMGNGGAMRAAPVGAYFADDFAAVVEQARISAAVTHAHPEGQAGAIAVAIAAAWACCSATEGGRREGRQMLEEVWEQTPEGETRQGIAVALTLPFELSPQTAGSHLGVGSRVISSDTVPFALWCAARHLDDYTEALWATVAGLGDRDTTCAIVGGIIALSAGRSAIPADWLEARETLLLDESASD